MFEIWLGVDFSMQRKFQTVEDFYYCQKIIATKWDLPQNKVAVSGKRLSMRGLNNFP